ncbi:MAG TPA: hypothetical protein VHO26_01185 [Propionibacteriaceae bacterium]|nr:hypothetical protein [Propionibacteriaceae bacterium]
MSAHPFYAPSRRLLSASGSRALGALSMGAYLAFWAVALVVAKHELDVRFPRPVSHRTPDSARELLRERFARGEIDVEEFRAMSRVLAEDAPRTP